MKRLLQMLLMAIGLLLVLWGLSGLLFWATGA